MSEKEVTQEMINEWKSKCGEVYKIEISDEVYFYRPLRRTEYKGIIQNADAATSYREEQIVQKCVLHPTVDVSTAGNTKAGVISTLTDCIMMVSGFGTENQPIKL